METYKNLEEFKYFVPVPEDQQAFIDRSFREWLMDFDDDYIILYNHYSVADGQWHTGPQYKSLFIAFRKEENAVACKLKWL